MDRIHGILQKPQGPCPGTHASQQTQQGVRGLASQDCPQLEGWFLCQEDGSWRGEKANREEILDKQLLDRILLNCLSSLASLP